MSAPESDESPPAIRAADADRERTASAPPGRSPPTAPRGAWTPRLAAGADYFWPVWPALGCGAAVGVIGAFAGFFMPRDEGDERRSLPE